MEYLIDTGDIKEIARIYEYYPISGVTTNPSIVAKAKMPLKSLIKEIRDIIGDKDMLHIQAISPTANEIVEEGKRIVDVAGENTYVKIPVNAEGLKAMKKLRAAGYKVTATAIFTPLQALTAANAGADYVAPYINRLDNISTNGIEIAGNIASLLNESKSESKVLAASFSNVEQIYMTTMHGVTTLTIAPALFDKMIYHPMTDSAIEEFINNGTPYYDI